MLHLSNAQETCVFYFRCHLSCDLASPGEGFILVDNEEDGQERESRASGSEEDTDGGYRSINGNSSPTVHDVRSGASATFRNYGSVNRSRSDGRQGDTREPWKWAGSVNGLGYSWFHVPAPTFALLLLPNHDAKVCRGCRARLGCSACLETDICACFNGQEVCFCV